MASEREERAALLSSRRTNLEISMDNELKMLAIAPRDTTARRNMARLCAEWCSVEHELADVEFDIAIRAARELQRTG